MLGEGHIDLPLKPLGSGWQFNDNTGSASCFPSADSLVADFDVPDELIDGKGCAADHKPTAEDLGVGNPARNLDAGQLINKGNGRLHWGVLLSSPSNPLSPKFLTNVNDIVTFNTVFLPSSVAA